MKKLRLIVPVLIICLFLSGCGFFLPVFFFNFSGEESVSQAETLPVGSDVAAHLKAEDVYYRAKFASGGEPLQYTEQADIGLRYADDDYEYPYLLHYDTQVVMSPEDCAVNVLTSVAFDGESPDLYQEYYRNENETLAYYFYDESTGECYREPLDLDGLTPYAVIVDYAVNGYPLAPEDLSLDPQTRLLNEREVYLLTFTESALYTFGSTGNAEYDRNLNQRNISHVWYVDAETYLPVQREFHLSQVDDLLGSILDSIYYLSLSEEGGMLTDFSYILKDMRFTPVSVPEIPDKIFKEAWKNAGYSDT
jgi:hypothetical protein